MMQLANQVGAEGLGLPTPPKEILEYYKDVRKPRFYKGMSWRFRPPTRAEQLAVIRYWAREAQASVSDEFVESYLACVSDLKDANDELGQCRSFQVKLKAKNKYGIRTLGDFLFTMDSSGKVNMVIDLN